MAKHKNNFDIFVGLKNYLILFYLFRANSLLGDEPNEFKHRSEGGPNMFINFILSIYLSIYLFIYWSIYPTIYVSFLFIKKLNFVASKNNLYITLS